MADNRPVPGLYITTCSAKIAERVKFATPQPRERAMSRMDPAELVSGALIFAIGAFFFLGAAEYPMGTMGRMGPGFVPRSLGAIGMGLGLIVATAAFRLPGRLPRVSWRALVTILSSIAVFGLFLPRVGLVVSVLLTSAVSMLANPEATPRMIAVVSVSLAVFCWLLFIVLLGLPFRAFDWSF